MSPRDNGISSRPSNHSVDQTAEKLRGILGKVWVSYNSAAYLQERHGFPKELLQNIAVVEALASRAAE